MHNLPAGSYITKKGSTVRVIRKGGGVIMNLDWFEEGSCENCYPDSVDESDLVWTCDECDGGRAKLEKADDR